MLTPPPFQTKLNKVRHHLHKHAALAINLQPQDLLQRHCSSCCHCWYWPLHLLCSTMAKRNMSATHERWSWAGVMPSIDFVIHNQHGCGQSGNRLEATFVFMYHLNWIRYSTQRHAGLLNVLWCLAQVMLAVHFRLDWFNISSHIWIFWNGFYSILFFWSEDFILLRLFFWSTIKTIEFFFWYKDYWLFDHAKRLEKVGPKSLLNRLLDLIIWSSIRTKASWACSLGPCGENRHKPDKGAGQCAGSVGPYLFVGPGGQKYRTPNVEYIF